MRDFLRRLFFRSSMDREVREELESHIALRAEKYRNSGMSDKEALFAARRQFGNAAGIQEQIYEFNAFTFLDTLMKDLRYAFRSLWRSPGLFLTVILTIAISVGTVANTFSLMRELLLAPPPHVSEPDRVYRVHLWFPDEDTNIPSIHSRTSYPFYELLAERAESIESVTAYMNGKNLAAGTGTEARMTRAVMVSAGYWNTLKTKPFLGRFFSDEEADPITGSRVVVLSHSFWKSKFRGSADVIGRTLKIKGRMYGVIGVAPKGFRGVDHADVDLWLPLLAEMDSFPNPLLWREFSTAFKILLRLKSDVTPELASKELTQLQRAYLEDTFGDVDQSSNSQTRVLFGPMTGGLGDDLRPVPEARVTLWLVGVACVLLIIACSNVAGLFMLRAMRRRHEIAVRLALGVSWGRLTRQFMTETSILAMLGGLMAVFALILGGTWVRRLILPAMAWEPAIMIDTSVLIVAGACIIGVTLVAGMAPLLYAKSATVTEVYKGSSGGSCRRPLAQDILLALQVALSIVLLVGAGLFMRSLYNAHTVDVGFDRDNVLAVQVDFSATDRTGTYEAAFYERALDRMSTLPGVERASLALHIPLRGSVASFFELPDRSNMTVQSTNDTAYGNAVTPGFFATAGMRILEGREFLDNERNRDDIVVVNETMARLYWPHRSPVGEPVYLDRSGKTATVVGVVADSRMSYLIEEKHYLWFYRPLNVAEEYFLPRTILMRMSKGFGKMDDAIRSSFYEMDSDLPFIKIETLGEPLNPQIRSWRLGASVFTAFGVFAIFLAMVGLWASVGYSVSQRTHEFAIRMAIGAKRRTLVSIVLKEGIRNILVTIAAGLLISYLGTRFIADMLYGISPHDPVVFVSVSIIVFMVAVLASLFPAFRAARIDPARSLRAD